MFSERAIVRNRARNDRNLPFTATIKGPSRTGGEGGNYVEDYDALFTARCRIAPSDVGASPNEHVIASADQSLTRWWVIFSWNVQQIKADHRLVVTGKDSSDGPTWTKSLEVLAVMDKRANRIMTKVLCVERT